MGVCIGCCKLWCRKMGGCCVDAIFRPYENWTPTHGVAPQGPVSVSCCMRSGSVLDAGVVLRAHNGQPSAYHSKVRRTQTYHG